MVIAKCAITSSDFETAKIHLDSAIQIAKQYSMNDLLTRLYIMYGKYFQELGLIKSPQQSDYLEGAKKMYDNAKGTIENIQNKYLLKELAKSIKSLQTFCCINNINA